MKKEQLSGKTLSEITQIVKDLGLPAFNAKQICRWLYVKKVSRIDEMTDLSLKARETLNERYEIGCSSPVSFQKSVDGTIKYLFQTNKNEYIESVFIPDKDRATLCVSSQVGCKMNCLFCMTGKQGFSDHLTAGEIINQIRSIPESDQLTNIVFMGMGEPLDNTDAVFKALEILTASWGYAWSPKRITVSSIGVKKGLLKFLDESKCHVAISMHSPFPDERLSIMPVEKAFPIEDVINILRGYDFSKQRRLSFEYIMFNEFNDSLRHAAALSRLVKGLDCRVNLIRYHAIPGINLKTSDEKKMVEFRDYLSDQGITCTIRSSRGEDIFAACGMLSSEESQRNSNDKI